MQYIVPILAAAALVTAPMWLDQDADAQSGIWNAQNFADLPAFLHEKPPNSGNCIGSEPEVDETKLPELTVRSPTVGTRGPCSNVADMYDAFVLIYKLGNGSQPHELVHRIDSEAASIRQTINLDDDGFGLGEYEIFYFLTDDTTNYLILAQHVTHAVATATMTIAPPPPGDYKPS